MSQAQGKESTFQWSQIQTPQMPLSFLFIFIGSLHFIICTMYFVLLKLNCKTQKQKQQYKFL